MGLSLSDRNMLQVTSTPGEGHRSTRPTNTAERSAIPCPMARAPDFDAMQQKGLVVLQEGLPILPKELEYSDMVPVSYWTTDLGGVVRFIFFIEDSVGVFHPADITFQYGRNEDGWHAIKTPLFLNAGRTGAIADPNFMRLSPNSVIEGYLDFLTDEPEPGRFALVMSGSHAPEVAEIWLVQGGRIDKRAASGHFGLWTICTELFEPLRVEAHDAAGALLGAADEPVALKAAFPEQALHRVSGHGAEQPHRYGGRVQIEEIECYASKVVVNWLIILDRNSDVQLAQDLEAHGFDSTDPWSFERIEKHVQLFDVLKLTVSSNQISLTDDIGTEYVNESGARSESGAVFTCSSTFEPSIPEGASVVTVHWEDLDLRIPLR